MKNWKNYYYKIQIYNGKNLEINSLIEVIHKYVIELCI